MGITGTTTAVGVGGRTIAVGVGGRTIAVGVGGRTIAVGVGSGVGNCSIAASTAMAPSYQPHLN